MGYIYHKNCKKQQTLWAQSRAQGELSHVLDLLLLIDYAISVARFRVFGKFRTNDVRDQMTSQAEGTHFVIEAPISEIS
jgi:hypothetical protein